jgi:KaiC/GvpD/RAD55 family RecA-like ATPase
MSPLSFEEIGEIIEVYKPKRVVFDSLNMFADPVEFRKSLSWRTLHKQLKTKNITSYLVTEKEFGIETKAYDTYDFLGDGVIFLDQIKTNEVEPNLTPVMAVQKMRATCVDTSPQPFRFTDKGISKYRTVNLTASKIQEKMNMHISASSYEPGY